MHFVQDAASAAKIVAHFANQGRFGALSYATVRDYCESVDLLPKITGTDGDLKNVQRPWAVKATLGVHPPPCRVLEIGGGEPIVSGFLADLGYTVTLVDPYDGFGNGPTDYERYCQSFPHIRIVRDYLRADTREFAPESFDVIFSVSVLEHMPEPALRSCFDAIAPLLRPGGASLHCFDFVLEGTGHEHALQNALQIASAQAALTGSAVSVDRILSDALERARGDLETFYLSAQGHNGWRGKQAYDDFPFRKVVSLQTVVLKPVP